MADFTSLGTTSLVDATWTSQTLSYNKGDYFYDIVRKLAPTTYKVNKYDETGAVVASSSSFSSLSSLGLGSSGPILFTSGTATRYDTGLSSLGTFTSAWSTAPIHCYGSYLYHDTGSGLGAQDETGSTIWTYTTAAGLDSVAEVGAFVFILDETTKTIYKLSRSTGALIDSLVITGDPRTLSKVGKYLVVSHSTAPNYPIEYYTTDLVLVYSYTASTINNIYMTYSSFLLSPPSRYGFFSTQSNGSVEYFTGPRPMLHGVIDSVHTRTGGIISSLQIGGVHVL